MFGLLVVSMWDDRFNAALLQVCPDPSATIAFIPGQLLRTIPRSSPHLLDPDLLQYRLESFRIMDLTGRHFDFERRPFRIDEDVDFAAKTAS